MVSKGIALKLKPRCYDEYKRRHDDLWPEMAAAMKLHGINMAIYRFDEYLFIYAAAPSEKAWADMKEDEVTPRWNRYMADVLETDERGEIVFHALPRAFAFGDLR